MERQCPSHGAVGMGRGLGFVLSMTYGLLLEAGKMGGDMKGSSF